MSDFDDYEVGIDVAAETDLKNIASYLVQQGADEAAQRLVDKLLDRIASLETFPMRGLVPREVEGASVRGFHQTSLGPYRVVYRVSGRQVVVVLVADGRRDMRALLRERLLGL